MAIDQVAAVARWLADQPARLVPLAALGAVLRGLPRAARREAARDVLAALDQLDTAGLVHVAHSFPMTRVGVLDRDRLAVLGRCAERDRDMPLR